MDAVLWYKKGNIKETVHSVLLPLLFHMSDETPSVAQVQMTDLTSMQARVCRHLSGGSDGNGE